MDDAFAMHDAFIARDASELPDAVMGDAFSPLDAPLPDAFAVPDAFMPDAFVTPDAPSSPCGDLRLYFRFENASGMLLDESGCENHGTPMDVLFSQPSPRGLSYRFTRPLGGPGFVVVPDSPSLSGFSQLTIEAWVRQTTPGYSFVASHGDGNDGDPFAFGTFIAGEPMLAIPNSPSCTGVNNPNAGVSIPVDTWTHIAVTLDTTLREASFFINGMFVFRDGFTAASAPLCDNPEPLVIGALRSTGAFGFQGWIDELRIWSVVRTQAQVCTDAGGVADLVGGCAL